VPPPHGSRRSDGGGVEYGEARESIEEGDPLPPAAQMFAGDVNAETGECRQMRRLGDQRDPLREAREDPFGIRRMVFPSLGDKLFAGHRFLLCGTPHKGA